MKTADMAAAADKRHEQILLRIVKLKGLLYDPRAAPEVKQEARRKLLALKQAVNGGAE